MTAYKRNIEGLICELLQQFPIVAILGVRQGGKTTIAQQVCQEWEYFDLERGRDNDLITSDYEFFFKEHPTKIIFDEAQLVPELLQELRGVVDRNRDQKGQFLITGSSSPVLLRNVSESLAGRVAIVELGTLKVNEIYRKPLPTFYSLFQQKFSDDTIGNLKELKVVCTEPEFLNAFFKGGYPDPVLSNDPIYYTRWMENYFRTYIDRDIRALFPKLDITKFRRFINILSSISATLINKSEIGRSVDLSEVTVRDYLEIAHSTYIWRNLYSYERDTGKSVVKTPKGLLRDTGLLHFLLGISNLETLKNHPLVGASFESFVSEEIIKGLQATSITNWKHYYYRTRNGAEIDLVLEGNFGLIPIEIKYGKNTSQRRLRSLKDFIQTRDCPIGLVINRGDKVELIADRIMQIPAHYI